jgi:predicted glycoside hydrolase/deacetylase ChbG (UPF0249 family)
LLIINADDFGWTGGHNLAVRRACAEGVLNGASLLCNGPAFAEALEIARELPELGVGLHLALNEGRPVLPPERLPNLARDGAFHDTIGALARLWAGGRLQAAEAQAEWRAQIERALAAGLRPAHLDSHKHVHLLPPLLSAFAALAVEYGIPRVRLPLETPPLAALKRGPGGAVLLALALRARERMRAAGLRFTQHFFGFADSGAMTAERLLCAVAQAGGESAEIMVHPAVITPDVAALREKYAWAARYEFAAELQALCDSRVWQRVTRKAARA